MLEQTMNQLIQNVYITLKHYNKNGKIPLFSAAAFNVL